MNAEFSEESDIFNSNGELVGQASLVSPPGLEGFNTFLSSTIW